METSHSAHAYRCKHVWGVDNNFMGMTHGTKTQHMCSTRGEQLGQQQFQFIRASTHAQTSRTADRCNLNAPTLFIYTDI